jgi:hypothetical protein
VAGTSTLNFTLTVTQAGLVLSGPATITYRQAATIQATPTGATTVVFYANKNGYLGVCAWFLTGQWSRVHLNPRYKVLTRCTRLIQSLEYLVNQTQLVFVLRLEPVHVNS